MIKQAKNTICLWYNGDAEEAAHFYAKTFPDSSVGAVHRAPGDFPSGKQGDVLTVEFTVMGIPCLGLNGGSNFKHNEAFSFQVATTDQSETDRYWNEIVGNGGEESVCGWCKDKWGLSWQITPLALTKAITDPDRAAAKRAFDAMMQMKKIDIAAIEAAPPDEKDTEMEKPMQLYEFAPTRSIRVRWMLQELGVNFEAVTVNLAAGEHRRPEFLKINPAGRVPVLVDGDLVITESVAIVLYLAEKYPHKGLIPTDLKQRSQVYRWLLFAATELEQPLWRIARHTRLYPEHLRLPAEVSLARQDFKDRVAVLEHQMQGCQFIVGNTVTIADFVCAYTLDWANEVGLLNDCPQLIEYMERMYARPNAPLRITAAFASLNA